MVVLSPAANTIAQGAANPQLEAWLKESRETGLKHFAPASTINAFEKLYANGNLVAGFSMEAALKNIPDKSQEAEAWAIKNKANNLMPQLLAIADTNVLAQAVLGSIYLRGLGGNAVDYGAALKWYEKAAQKGDAVAQVTVGSMYHNGQGVKQNFAIARQWFEKAAQQGHPGAQYILAGMYYDGRGVKQDFALARQWYEKAAAQGYAPANKRLDEMNKEGR